MGTDAVVLQLAANRRRDIGFEADHVVHILADIVGMRRTHADLPSEMMPGLRGGARAGFPRLN